MSDARRPRHWWTAMIAGCCATLAGIGLQRFAYGPLLPAMVQGGWLSAPGAGTLAAVNLGGYLVGALAAGAVGRRFGLVPALRGAMLVTAASFAVCAIPGGLAWLLPWRALAGFAGAVLMVLAGPAIQLAVPPERRGLAAGVMLAGVGSGILVGAALVPLILPAGIAAAWLALGLATLLISALTWQLWPDAPPPRRALGVPALTAPSWRLIGTYSLAAIAATPHMIWWPDFIARGLGRGTAVAAAYWLAFGLGAAIGPSLFGRLGDRLGAGQALSITLAVQAAAIAVPLVAEGPAALLVSSVATGSCALAVSALTLTRARELAGEQASQVWRLGTAAYGAAQSGAGFALAALYAQTGSHLSLFAIGLAAGVVAVIAAEPDRRAVAVVDQPQSYRAAE
jgi:predicted MFS family arabinose efflux permease